MNSRRSRDECASARRWIVSFLTGGLAIAMCVVATGPASARSSSPLRQAKKALLVVSDMPPGWTSTKSSNSNSSFPGAAQLARCLGIPKSVINSNPPTANSREFDSKDHLQSVSDSVSIYRSTKAARADFTSLANPKTPTCLTRVLNGSAHTALQSQFGSGASVGKILVSRSPSSEFARGTANFTAFVPVTTHGISINVELTVVDFVKGHEEQTVVLTSVQSPFPSSLAQHLTTVAVRRL